MKRWVLFAALGILVAFIGCTKIQSAQDVPRISKDGLKAKLGSPGMVLIDVRTESDWKESSEEITGALHMDPASVDAWAATLPRDKEIVLYCA